VYRKIVAKDPDIPNFPMKLKTEENPTITGVLSTTDKELSFQTTLNY
jgi:hypothetical protein